MSFINSPRQRVLLLGFSIKDEANNFASRQVAYVYSVTRGKHDRSRGNKRVQPPFLQSTFLNLYLDGSSLTAGGGGRRGGCNTLFFSWLSWFVCSRIPAIEPTNPALPPSLHSGPTLLPPRKASDTDPRDTGYPCQVGWPPVTPSVRVRSLLFLFVVRSRLGRISRYPLDVAHRFESVFESWNRGGEARKCLRQDSGNRTKSNYLRDSWRWCIRDISRRKKKEVRSLYRFLSELRALRYFKRRATDIGDSTRGKLWRERMLRTCCVRVVDEEASWRRFQECVPRARIDASIGNSRRDGMAKRDYELNAIK